MGLHKQIGQVDLYFLLRSQKWCRLDWMTLPCDHLICLGCLNKETKRLKAMSE